MNRSGRHGPVHEKPDGASAGARTTVEAQLAYMSGFGNSFETEALDGALPVGRNSPQKCAYGLYAEQLSGSAFTAPNGKNERSWLYRIRPAVKHSAHYAPVDRGLIRTAPNAEERRPMLGQLRWDPSPLPSRPLSFVEGLATITTAGDSDTQVGMAAHVAMVTRSMENEYVFNSDGELLVVAQHGRLRFRTEFGVIEIEPGEICVIPRGIIFSCELVDGPAGPMSARTTAGPSPCPTGARSGRTASPTRAIS